MSKDHAEIKHARRAKPLSEPERRQALRTRAGAAQLRRAERAGEKVVDERRADGSRRSKADRQPSVAGVVPLGRDYQFLRR